jgi:hypothetical protein
MRIKIIDLVARVLGVLVHVDGLPYGRGPTNHAAGATNPCTAPSALPPTLASY